MISSQKKECFLHSITLVPRCARHRALRCLPGIPHAELAAPEEFVKKYRDELLPEEIFVGVDSGRLYKNGGYASQPEPHATFAAMINVLDVQVGEIRKKLEALGIADNTIIIFTSDNGPHEEGGVDPDYFNSNAQFRGYKRDLYEGGIRVPMIAYWANKIQAGATTDHLSAFWDVLPTVCDLIGIEKPLEIDGISFLPTLLGQPQKKHAYLYWEFGERGGKQAVRWDHWKAVRLAMSDNPTAAIELYDLSSDIGEKNNIANEYPERVEQAARMMLESHTRSKDFSFKFEVAKDNNKEEVE